MHTCISRENVGGSFIEAIDVGLEVVRAAVCLSNCATVYLTILPGGLNTMDDLGAAAFYGFFMASRNG